VFEQELTPTHPQPISRLVAWSGAAFIASLALSLVFTFGAVDLEPYLAGGTLVLGFVFSSVALSVSSVTLSIAVWRNPPDFFLRAGFLARLALSLVFFALVLVAGWSVLFVVTALIFRVH
jgi:hypothetical protein